MGVSENSVPLNPLVNDHYPVFKWLFHWEYTQHFQTNPYETVGDLPFQDRPGAVESSPNYPSHHG